MRYFNLALALRSAAYRGSLYASLSCFAFIAAIISPGAISKNLYVERIGLEQGLSQNTVTSIAQDSKGFMWFGTQIALNRYDGYKFTHFKNIRDDPNSISDGSSWALLNDSQNRLWIGTYNGLNLYISEKNHFESFQHDPNNPQSLSHNSIWSLLEDHQGYLWVGTGQGLNRFDPKTKIFTRFLNSATSSNSISNNVINTLFQDNQGILWIGTDQGLNRFKYQSQQFELTFSQSGNLENSIITSITEDTDGILWVGTKNKGLFILDKTRTVINQYTHDPTQDSSISSDKITALLNDSKNQIWIGTDNGGLNLFDHDSGQFIRYLYNPNNPKSLSENIIYSLFEDNTGILWVGTYTKGISKVNPYGFSSSLVLDFPSNDNPDPHTDIRAFLVDQNQALWVGSSSNGIRVTHKNGKKTRYRYDPNDDTSISSDKVYCFYEDSEGTIWIGTAHGWLNKFNRARNSFIRYKVQPKTPGSIRHGKVLAINEDSSGLLWLGLERGAAHSFDRKTNKFTHFHHDPNDSNTINHDRVFDLYIDEADNVWFATYGGGLNQYIQKAKRFIHYQHDPNDNNSISNNYISVIHKDINDSNILWLSTDGRGLDRMDVQNQSFQNYDNKNGLSDNNLYGIVQDDKGRLWLAHNSGLSRFEPDNLKFVNYEKDDGLQSNEFNGGANYRAADGKLFLGGIEGYNAFYTDQIIDNPYKPPVYITEFQLFNNPVPINKSIGDRILLPKSITELESLVLSYKDTVFSFEFSALNYALSSKNEFAYKMEGLEENWNYVDSKRRFATYTTLPPGDYSFKVKASNNNGVWNEEGAQLAITITPPAWQTWWFRLTTMVFVVLIGFIAYALRMRAIKERNKILKKQVKERTMELESALLELGETKDALIEAAHKAGMADTATSVLHNVGNLLNSVNTSAGLIYETIETSVTKKVRKVNEILIKHKENLKEFIANDSRGEKLLNYMIELDKPLLNENSELKENAHRLNKLIKSINETVKAQQRFAHGAVLEEKLALKDTIEEILLLQMGSIGRHEIKITKEYDESTPKIKVQKTKLIQILINLYNNAKESMDAHKDKTNEIIVKIYYDNEYEYLSFSDTGLGIEADKLETIFSHGYTTKKDNHGYGLHSCANFMTEMGGKIWAESKGPNKGAKFILKFPLNNTDHKMAKAI